MKSMKSVKGGKKKQIVGRMHNGQPSGKTGIALAASSALHAARGLPFCRIPSTLHPTLWT